MQIEKVSGHLPTPLYHQIFMILRDQIVSGRLSAGALLPGEEEIARLFKVSRITARRSLAELAAEGLITRSRGRGSHVAAKAEQQPILGGVEGLLENLIAMGLKTRVALLEFDYVPAAAEVAEALRVPVGSEVQRAVRVRSLAAGPFSHLTTFVPADLGRKFSRRELEQEPLLSLLERSGAVIEGADQTITATLADARMAPLLATSLGAPLLRISRIVHDRTGRPVEYITALYRPDLYQFRMSLERIRGAASNTWSARPAPAQGRRSPTPRQKKGRARS